MAAYILVVDDDPDLRSLLRLHLAGAGYDVEVAADAIEAGHSVLARAPDLIIIDVKMPYMDGFEFVAALRTEESLKHTPVIFLTSVADGDLRGKELGALAYLVKPIRADRLLELVLKILPPERPARG